MLKAFPMSVNVVCGCELLRLCMYLLRVFKLGVLFSTVHKYQLCSLVLEKRTVDNTYILFYKGLNMQSSALQLILGGTELKINSK